jgi:hypothetical protein
LSSQIDETYRWTIEKREPHCYFVYETPELNDGDKLEVKGTDLYLNGKELNLEKSASWCEDDFDDQKSTILNITGPRGSFVYGQLNEGYYEGDEYREVVVSYDWNLIRNWIVPIKEKVENIGVGTSLSERGHGGYDTNLYTPGLELVQPFKKSYSFALDEKIDIDLAEIGDGELYYYGSFEESESEWMIKDHLFEFMMQRYDDPILVGLLTSTEIKTHFVSLSLFDDERQCQYYYITYKIDELNEGDLIKVRDMAFLQLNGNELNPIRVIQGDCGELPINIELPVAVAVPDQNVSELAHLFPVKDTVCKNPWPAGEGEMTLFGWRACDLFEVADEDLLVAVEEAHNCCTLDNPDTLLCAAAWENRHLTGGVIEGELGLKQCMGLYIIHGLGTYGQWATDYYWPEIHCRSYWNNVTTQRILGNTVTAPVPSCYQDANVTTNVNQYPLVVNNLECRELVFITDYGWVSDTDMSQNSCFSDYMPAHVTFEYLNTGTCADYSILATTLLRMAGYDKTEVFSVANMRHAYNLIKLPLENDYIIFDTTGNFNPTGVLKVNANHKYYSIVDGNGVVQQIDFCDFYSIVNDSEMIHDETNVEPLMDRTDFTNVRLC